MFQRPMQPRRHLAKAAVRQPAQRGRLVMCALAWAVLLYLRLLSQMWLRLWLHA